MREKCVNVLCLLLVVCVLSMFFSFLLFIFGSNFLFSFFLKQLSFRTSEFSGGNAGGWPMGQHRMSERERAFCLAYWVIEAHNGFCWYINLAARRELMSQLFL